MEYGYENQIDPKPIELREIKGRGIDPDGVALFTLCVGLFTEQEHKLIRYAQCDDAGNFLLDTKGIPDGEYRFVGRSPGFCPANALVKIRSHSHRKKTVVVHMRPQGIDDCSYVDVGKTHR